MGKVATLAEVRAAQRFLSMLHAPTQSNLLIIAVVAWMRVEGKGFDIGEAARAILKRSIFTPTLPGPYMGWAQYNANMKAQAESYQLVLAAARHNQPADFLYALALTSWDSNHYGGYGNGLIDAAKNALLKMYGTFTGLTLPTPKVKVPKPPPPPTQIAAKLHQVPDRPYLDGYQMRGFYEARNGAVPDLPR